MLAGETRLVHYLTGQILLILARSKEKYENNANPSILTICNIHESPAFTVRLSFPVSVIAVLSILR